MSQPETELEKLSSRLRRTEARLAQVEDQLSLRPPRRLPIPELTREQKQTVMIALTVMFVIFLGRRFQDR